MWELTAQTATRLSLHFNKRFTLYPWHHGQKLCPDRAREMACNNFSKWIPSLTWFAWKWEHEPAHYYLGKAFFALSPWALVSVCCCQGAVKWDCSHAMSQRHMTIWEMDFNSARFKSNSGTVNCVSSSWNCCEISPILFSHSADKSIYMAYS